MRSYDYEDFQFKFRSDVFWFRVHFNFDKILN